MGDLFSSLKFYTLFHFRDGKSVYSVNGQAGLPEFIGCINTLGRSLKRQGFGLTVITNLPEELGRHLDQGIDTLNLEFTLEIPQDIEFYSDHYKLEVFDYFSRQKGQYSILIDSDIVCLGPVPPMLSQMVEQGIPTVYEITDQAYPAYSQERLIQDKSLVMGRPSTGSWFGGEYIGGTATFYADLYAQVKSLWPSYLQNWRKLHHQGNEVVRSCAVEALQLQGTYIVNLGIFDGICRYWDVATLHVERKVESLRGSFLLHLPALKKLLANLNVEIDFFHQLEKFHRAEKWQNSYPVRTFHKILNRLSVRSKQD